MRHHGIHGLLFVLHLTFLQFSRPPKVKGKLSPSIDAKCLNNADGMKGLLLSSGMEEDLEAVQSKSEKSNTEVQKG